MKLHRSLKTIFIIFLMVVFFFKMFLPSMKRFLANEVLVMVSTEPEAREGQITVEPLIPPAVTFCAYQDIFAGWNITAQDHQKFDFNIGFIRTYCEGTDMMDVDRCVKERTFPLSSIIKQTNMNSSLWSSDMATVYHGLCHTFHNPEKIRSTEIGGEFFLKPNMSYKVIIHDPQFYHILTNSLITPRIWLDFKAGQNVQPGHLTYFDITTTHHILINRPEKPCEEEEDYDFLGCVKTSQARMVGCRPPWDSWSPHTIPLCETMEELEEYEILEYTFLTYERKMILNQTGCRVPCKYKQYKLVGEPMDGPMPPIRKGEYGDSHFLLLYEFASTEITVKREVWAFSTISFISELGGALSLFVGISALSVWDMLDYISSRYQRKFWGIF